MSKKVNVAIVGCGNISGIYLENLTDIVKHVTLDNVNVYALLLSDFSLH